MINPVTCRNGFFISLKFVKSLNQPSLYIIKMMNPVTCRNGFSETLFRIISCYNLLRGLFLFIMFVCKTTVIRKVKKTLGIETSSTTTPSKKDSTGASQFSSNDGHSMHTTADSMHTTVHSTPETGRRRAGTIQTR